MNIICLTPVRNEAWILEQFLEAASIWADHIIIADQNSDDDTAGIAKGFSKVRIIENASPTFNEPERQRMLIEAAREIPMPRLLIALDADEFLTPNFFKSPEWSLIKNAPAGSVISFKLANIRPDLSSYWIEDGDFRFGFMDDGASEHKGTIIHSTRVPSSQEAPLVHIKDIKVMHYQYTDWKRMESKHRWYQCWERLNNPKLGPIEKFRMYHHMYSVAPENIKDIPEWWFKGYFEYGIDIKNIKKDAIYWWDREVINFFKKYGPGLFSREAVWDINWEEKANILGFDKEYRFSDPRSRLEKYIHKWLRATQMRSNKMVIKQMDNLLKRLLRW